MKHIRVIEIGDHISHRTAETYTFTCLNCGKSGSAERLPGTFERHYCDDVCAKEARRNKDRERKRRQRESQKSATATTIADTNQPDKE